MPFSFISALPLSSQKTIQAATIDKTVTKARISLASTAEF
jgi:hypothetical protein